MYENVYIGNFIYLLGLLQGRKSPDQEIKGNMNLFQQTPGDYSIGDLLGRVDSKNFLIEFKREENKDDKEIEKQNHLKKRLNSYRYIKMKQISEKAHFYLKILKKEDSILSSKVFSYIDNWSDDKNAIEVKTFIECLLASVQVNKIGVSRDKMAEYIRFLLSDDDGKGGDFDHEVVQISVCKDGMIHAFAYGLDKERNRCNSKGKDFSR